MSRPRVPTKLKVLRGTARSDRMPRNEPKPQPIAPSRPAGLSAAARRLWDELAPRLERLGLLTEVDGPMLEALCEAWARYQMAKRRWRRVVRTVDPVAGISTIRTAETLLDRAEQSVRHFAAEFGLSPSARAKLDVPNVADDEEGALEAIWGSR